MEDMLQCEVDLCVVTNTSNDRKVAEFPAPHSCKVARTASTSEYRRISLPTPIDGRGTSLSASTDHGVSHYSAPDHQRTSPCTPSDHQNFSQPTPADHVIIVSKSAPDGFVRALNYLGHVIWNIDCQTNPELGQRFSPCCVSSLPFGEVVMADRSVNKV